MISVNIICKNEENFIWFSIMSVLEFVDEILICDTGSSDNTIQIINSIKSDKIKFTTECLKIDELVKVKNEMILKSKNEWIMILDADEIWTQEQLIILLEELKKIPKDNNLVKVFRREVMPDFSITEKSNNLYATRFIRNFTNTSFINEYPREILSADGKRKIWNLNNEYYHYHNFVRSSKDTEVHARVERMKNWWYQGKNIKTEFIPDVFLRTDLPAIVKNPYLKD